MSKSTISIKVNLKTHITKRKEVNTYKFLFFFFEKLKEIIKDCIFSFLTSAQLIKGISP